MDLGRPTTTNKAQALIGMFHYYRDRCTRWSHILDSLTEEDSGPKDISILWNYDLEVSLHELRQMVSSETLLNYIDWIIPFTVHIYSSDKKMGAVTSQNDKPMALFMKKSSKPQNN